MCLKKGLPWLTSSKVVFRTFFCDTQTDHAELKWLYNWLSTWFWKRKTSWKTTWSFLKLNGKLNRNLIKQKLNNSLIKQKLLFLWRKVLQLNRKFISLHERKYYDKKKVLWYKTSKSYISKKSNNVPNSVQ